MLARLLAILLLFAPVAAHADWRRATSEHFVVYSELPDTALRTFTEKIERYDRMLRRLTNTTATEPGNKLTIFVPRDQTAIARLAGDVNVYGFYKPEIYGSFAFVPRYSGSGRGDLDSETVLFHEYAHHFMLQYHAVGYPAWYVEGFAEFFGNSDINADGSVSIGRVAAYRAFGIVKGPPMPLTRLFAADQGPMSDEVTESFYGWSWMLTHYLRFTESRAGQLGKYLALFAKGTPPMDAAEQAFGDIAAMQRELNAYAAARTLHYSQVKGVDLTIKPVETAALPADESDLMPLFMRMMRGSRNAQDVAAFQRDARRDAAHHPGSALAQDMLAEGELDADAFDAAIAANEAVLKHEPGNARALLRRARIAIAQMEKAGGGGAAAWRAARLLAVKANHAAPDDPYPLVVNYRTYLGEGVTPPPVALAGLRRAVELAPQVSESRLLLGRALRAAGRRDEARMTVEPLLNDPHSVENRGAALAIITDSPPPSADKTNERTKAATAPSG